MKTRKGFVSNSSSSSFIILKDALTREQIVSLINFCSQPVGIYRDSWDVYESEHYISGHTVMYNSCGEGDEGLTDWFRKNNFPMKMIKWDD